MALKWNATRKADSGSGQTSEVCTLCNGEGGHVELTTDSTISIRYENETWVECLCAGRRKAKQYLSRVWPELTDLAEVPVDAALIERLGQSCRITASWDAFGLQLRAAVLSMRRQCAVWRVAVYRDSALGALANADRVARAFDDASVERIDEAADLIVVRIGFAVRASAAISTTICNLIADRAESPSRRIWILDDPRSLLNEKSKAWGDGMAEALGRLDHFEVES